MPQKQERKIVLLYETPSFEEYAPHIEMSHLYISFGNNNAFSLFLAVGKTLAETQDKVFRKYDSWLRCLIALAHPDQSPPITNGYNVGFYGPREDKLVEAAGEFIYRVLDVHPGRRPIIVEPQDGDLVQRINKAGDQWKVRHEDNLNIGNTLFRF